MGEDYTFIQILCKNYGLFPWKTFTEISPRLARSHRDWRDLAKIDDISLRLQRSHHDLTMMFVSTGVLVLERTFCP